MVNGLYLFSAFLVFSATQSTLQHKSTFTHSHTHIHTLRAGDFSTKSRPAHQELIHTHSHINAEAIRSSSGFNILPTDTSTCRPEEPGTEPPTFSLADDPLYLLSQSLLCGIFCIRTLLDTPDLLWWVYCVFWRILEMPSNPLWKLAVTSAMSSSSQHCTFYYKSDVEHCTWSEKSL